MSFELSENNVILDNLADNENDICVLYEKRLSFLSDFIHMLVTESENITDWKKQILPLKNSASFSHDFRYLAEFLLTELQKSDIEPIALSDTFSYHKTNSRVILQTNITEQNLSYLLQQDGIELVEYSDHQASISFPNNKLDFVACCLLLL